MSRIMSRFRSDGSLQTERSRRDGRRQIVRLTPRGGEIDETLNRRSEADAEELLARLHPHDQERLVAATSTIQRIIAPPKNGPWRTRQLISGDIGWVVHRHGVVYANEYGWDQTFEALVARICAD